MAKVRIWYADGTSLDVDEAHAPEHYDDPGVVGVEVRADDPGKLPLAGGRYLPPPSE